MNSCSAIALSGAKTGQLCRRRCRHDIVCGAHRVFYHRDPGTAVLKQFDAYVDLLRKKARRMMTPDEFNAFKLELDAWYPDCQTRILGRVLETAARTTAGMWTFPYGETMPENHTRIHQS